ncbi:MAG: murein transglycosylase A [Stellaceae bacterium]
MVVLIAGLAGDAGPPRLSLVPVSFTALDGWAADHLAAALPALLKSCARLLRRPEDAAFGAIASGADYGTVAEWREPCRMAALVPAGDEVAARGFFEAVFTAMAIADAGRDDGLFTGYFSIELNGSRSRHGPYQTPIYRPPPANPAAPRCSRAQIEDGALADRGLALLWVDDPIAAFFLQIQGSGRIRLDDGQLVRVGYAGQNGLPYVPVGRLLVERGDIPRGKVTMASIMTWMRAHPKRGAALRREDPSYVFFREINGPGPIGAERVVLTPQRSLAVDPAYVPLGTPVWLDADERFLVNQHVRGLVIAQDAGGAIKGPVRGDLYWGAGKAAGDRAGAMNARGREYLLLPRRTAARLAAEEARR